MLKTIRPLLALVAAALVLPCARAQGTGAAEYQVKAAFIYNFAKYVEWPDSVLGPKDGSITLCIIGRDPFGAAFDALEGRQVHGHALRVRRGVTFEDAAGCHVAFIADSEERRYPALLRALGNAPILTMSDIEGFAEAGGAVGMVMAEDRLQFEANFATLQRTNLKASSQALKLARVVHGMKK